MSILANLHDLCVSKEISVAVAESCTSGLIASKLTLKPGSSTFFKGGTIAYQNDIKIKILGVDEQAILQYTEVSTEVVRQMAEGVRKSFSADYSIATSGYAGPSGGTNNNSIGTVFIAISSVSGVDVERFIFSGNRQSIVNQASEKSLSLLYDAIKKH
jgi:nicotinamide-nucleotide amidase